MITLFEEAGEPARRALLLEMISGPKTVTDLCKSTGLKQANVSNHLARMRRKNLVLRDKRGREAYYRIASPELTEAMSNLMPTLAERSDALDFPALIDQYVDAGLKGDEQSCARIVDRAIRAGLTLVSIDEDLLTAAITAVQVLYEKKQCDEAEEHLFRCITDRMIARVSMVRQSFGRQGRTALLGCATSACDQLSLRMLNDYLRSSGWRTLYLGGTVPHMAFLRQVESNRPDLVLIDMDSGSSIEEARELIRGVHAFRGRGLACMVGVGGVAAAKHSRELLSTGADFVSHSLREFAYEILPNLDLPIRHHEGWGVVQT
jgi:methanogenic corrinoid protein MtbC1